MKRDVGQGFDRIARPYRWLEYLSFGRALERCRFRTLPQLNHARHALVLGDGDGRFTARLLQGNAAVQIDAVDASRSMLQLLQQRCASPRVRTHAADLSRGLPIALREQSFDLITTHFFLDCLTTAQAGSLAHEVHACSNDEARWIVSEFAVPQRGLMHWPSWLIVRTLYMSFRLLTGLQPQHLPDYHAALHQAGFVMTQSMSSLCGLLVSEIWQKRIK